MYAHSRRSLKLRRIISFHHWTHPARDTWAERSLEESVESRIHRGRPSCRSYLRHYARAIRMINGASRVIESRGRIVHVVSTMFDLVSSIDAPPNDHASSLRFRSCLRSFLSDVNDFSRGREIYYRFISLLP